MCTDFTIFPHGVVLLEPVLLLGPDPSVLLAVAGAVVVSPRLVHSYTVFTWVLSYNLVSGVPRTKIFPATLDLFTTSSFFFYLLDRHSFMSA